MPETALITVERGAADEAAQPAAAETLPTAHQEAWAASIAEGGVLVTHLNALAAWWRLHLKTLSMTLPAARLAAWRVAAVVNAPTMWES